MGLLEGDLLLNTIAARRSAGNVAGAVESLASEGRQQLKILQKRVLKLPLNRWSRARRAADGSNHHFGTRSQSNSAANISVREMP